MARADANRFWFALEGSLFITHNSKLGNAEHAVANFLASAPLVLGAKLGPIVWPLPSISASTPSSPSDSAAAAE